MVLDRGIYRGKALRDVPSAYLRALLRVCEETVVSEQSVRVASWEKKCLATAHSIAMCELRGMYDYENVPPSAKKPLLSQDNVVEYSGGATKAHTGRRRGAAGKRKTPRAVAIREAALERQIREQLLGDATRWLAHAIMWSLRLAPSSTPCAALLEARLGVTTSARSQV